MAKRRANLFKRIRQLDVPIPMMPALRKRRPTGRRREPVREIPTK